MHTIIIDCIVQSHMRSRGTPRGMSLRGRREQIASSTAATSAAAVDRGSVLGNLDGADAVHRAISPENARTRRRGQLSDLAVVAGGEPDQVAAVDADRVPRLVRVRQVGEEIVDVAGQGMARRTSRAARSRAQGQGR
jgi:hypothetical protein